MVCSIESTSDWPTTYNRSTSLVSWSLQPFVPLFRNSHFLTLAGNFWPRALDERRFPVAEKTYRTEPGVQILVHEQRPEGRAKGELITVHGLEGSSQSGYARSLAQEALEAGFAVHRYNMRSCGGTEAICGSLLYHSGQTSDLFEVAREIAADHGPVVGRHRGLRIRSGRARRPPWARPFLLAWSTARRLRSRWLPGAHDRESGEFTVYHLKQCLRAVAACPDVERVHLIAHSRGTDVTISADAASMPVLDTAHSVHSLNIPAGASLTLAGNDLRVSNSLTNQGTLILQGTSGGVSPNVADAGSQHRRLPDLPGSP